MRELKKICDPMIKRMHMPQFLWDDLYDKAVECLEEGVRKYDMTKGASFKTFLTGIIKYRFSDWIRNSNRGKRRNVERNFDGTIKKDESGNALVKYDQSIDQVYDGGSSLLEKIVNESIMASKYIDNWNKEIEKMCEFLNENAAINDFVEFKELVLSLEKVVTEDVASMFNSKDSFIWFTMFTYFRKVSEEDEIFIEFMRAFLKTLHSKKVNGINYDDLSYNKENGKVRGTKDKNTVIHKIELLEMLMYEFMGINKVKIE